MTFQGNHRSNCQAKCETVCRAIVNSFANGYRYFSSTIQTIFQSGSYSNTRIHGVKNSKPKIRKFEEATDRKIKIEIRKNIRSHLESSAVNTRVSSVFRQHSLPANADENREPKLRCMLNALHRGVSAVKRGSVCREMEGRDCKINFSILKQNCVCCS